METETFLDLAVRLGYLTDQTAGGAFALVTEIDKTLVALRNRLAPKRTPSS
jgi:hypothetical protein